MRSIAIASSSASPAISERGGAGARAALLALLLLVPAMANGFPLIFPDSGTYLGIATGHDYAIDRSSLYGLLWKPFVTLAPGLGGLWLALAAQALAVAAILLLAARALAGKAGLIACIAAVPLTSLAWHAGQIMPDAFTGPLVLLACLAATRDPTAPGTPLLWLAALVLAMTHYTHVVLLAAVAAAAIAASHPSLSREGKGWVRESARQNTLLPPDNDVGRSIEPRPPEGQGSWRRLAAATLVTLTAIALLAAANGAVLGRRAMSPLGPVFLFARLNADGLIAPWLASHCGQDAPAPLCAERHRLPRNSQALLWGGGASPLTAHIWQAGEAERWRWVDMLATANRGAIAERPLAFLASATQGTLRQFATFGALDDECPAGCGRNPTGGLALILARDRPMALPALRASMQYRDTTPKRLIRAITTPVAILALLLLPGAAILAWRRRDRLALAFVAGTATALIVNAALAGALSDVHDRYQSRLVWLAPFLLLLLALRWRRSACPPRLPGA